MTLTEKETKVLLAYKEDDFVGDKGWDSTEAGAWVEGFNRDCAMGTKVFAGVLASLVKKGVCLTNGESFTLTPKGIELAGALIAEERGFDALARVLEDIDL